MSNMILELFMTTMKEYIRFAKQLPYDSINTSTYKEQDYVAIQTRLMLIRKFITKGDNVYFEDIINESISRFPSDKNEFTDMLKKFTDIFSKSFEQILSDGTKLDLPQSIKDIIYGLYLHADEKRIINLSKTSGFLRFFVCLQFISDLEPVLISLYEKLEELGVVCISEMKHTVGPVVYLGDTNNSDHNIKKSPYWQNLRGKDGTTNDILEAMSNYSEDELKIYLKGYMFLTLLSKGTVDPKEYKQILFKHNFSDWGDFSKAIKYYKNINKPSISSYIEFFEDGKCAKMKVLENFDNIAIINEPHMLGRGHVITFIKENNDWFVFAFGGTVNPFKP